jgi:hypothetical protein
MQVCKYAGIKYARIKYASIKYASKKLILNWGQSYSIVRKQRAKKDEKVK